MLDHAALSGAFSPRRFLYDLDREQEAKALRSLAPLCDEELSDNKILWRLTTSARSRLLAELATRPSDLRIRWRTRGPTKKDYFARALKAGLTASYSEFDRILDEVRAEPPAAVGTLEDNDLVTPLREAISAIIFALPHVDKKERKALRQIEDRYERVAEVRARTVQRKAILSGGLHGRNDERDAVRAFLNEGVVAPPIDPLPQRDGSNAGARLLITGGPGMGKSAFLVDLLKTIEESSEEILPIHFDFDLPTLCFGGETAWTDELTRQIGFAKPELERDLSRVRAQAAARRRRLGGDSGEVGSGSLLRSVSEQLAGFSSRVLIFADTAEELIARDRRDLFSSDPAATRFWQFIDWTEVLGDFLGAGIGVVLAGRTDPPVPDPILAGWFAGWLKLPPLQSEPASQLLYEHAAFLDTAELSACVDAVGGMPLHLILVAKQLSMLPPEERQSYIAELQSEGLPGAKSNRVMQTLYSRFIDRLGSIDLPTPLTIDDIRRLAHPGLLLREVTPTLLREVIAPAAGVDLSNLDHLNAAFDALRRQVWLVVPGSTPESLRHHPETRRAMVPLMLSEDRLTDDDTDGRGEVRQRVRGVLDRAIEWFESKANPTDRAEAAFLRALRGDIAPLITDPDLARRVAEFAGEDLAHMPLGARALVKFHGSDTPRLTEEEIRALPDRLAREASIREFEVQSRAGLTPDEGIVETSQMTGALSDEDDLGWIQRDLDGGGDLASAQLRREIEFSFLEADFARVSRLGWTALKLSMESENLEIKFQFEDLDDPNNFLWQLGVTSILWPPPDEDLELVAGSFEKAIDSPGQMVKSPLMTMLPVLLSMAGKDLARKIDKDANSQIQSGNGGNNVIRILTSMSETRAAITDGELEFIGSDADLRLETMPLLQPDFRAGIEAGGIRLRSRGKSALGKTLQRLFSSGQLLPEDHNELMEVFEFERSPETGYHLHLTLGPSANWLTRPAIRAALRGTTPELHETLRASIARLPAQALDPALEAVRMQVDLWPIAMTERIGSLRKASERRAVPLHRSIIRYVDALGRLKLFVQTLAEETARPDIEKTGRLLGALDRFWRF